MSVTDAGNVIVPALNNTGTKVVTVDGTGTLGSTATIAVGNLPDLAGDVTGPITSNNIAADAVGAAADAQARVRQRHAFGDADA